MNQLLTEYVNIDVFPQISPTDRYQINSGAEITIGDLHANFLKFIFMLLRHQVITNLNEANYARLVEIYKMKTSDLNQSLLTEFNHILDSLEFNPKSRIRLIGDEFADRGKNDYFTLKLIEKLKKANIPLEILLSNHGAEFVLAYETYKTFKSTMIRRNTQCNSINQLQELINKKLVSREDVIALANEYYKPCIRPISYTISADYKNLVIYSHAPIDLFAIQSLAKKFQLEYQANSIKKLADTIDAINQKFQEHVYANSVNTLISIDNVFQIDRPGFDVRNAPIEFIMWNRKLDILNRHQTYQDGLLSFVHGHASKPPKEKHVINLDNKLGKSANQHEGIYTVLYAQKYQAILTQINNIKQHGQILNNQGAKASAVLAFQLYNDLSTAFENFKLQKINLQTFQTDSLANIKKVQPELEKHDAWKQLLANLVLAILGLGALYLLAGLYNKATTGNFLFFRTENSKRMEELTQTIQSIPD